jgi:hypothetical protein
MKDVAMFTSCRAFLRLGQAEFADGGLIKGLSQFTQLTLLPLKMMLNLKKVKIDSKIIILLCYSKSMTHSVDNNWKN